MSEHQSSPLAAVPAEWIEFFCRDRETLAALVSEAARRTGDGNLARAHGILIGKRAGRKVIDTDEAFLRDVGQLIADGKRAAEALKLVASAHPGHSYAATLDRLRRKWRRLDDSRREKRGILFHPRGKTGA